MAEEKDMKPILTFNDIHALDDRAIINVILKLDSTDLVKALFGASTEVREKIFSNMAERASTMLKEDMEYHGPVSPELVEEARQKIVELARSLQNSGGPEDKK